MLVKLSTLTRFLEAASLSLVVEFLEEAGPSRKDTCVVFLFILRASSPFTPFMPFTDVCDDLFDPLSLLPNDRVDQRLKMDSLVLFSPISISRRLTSLPFASTDRFDMRCFEARFLARLLSFPAAGTTSTRAAASTGRENLV